MASHVSDQDMRACHSPPSKRENGKRRRGERWPVGGGLISRPSVLLLFSSPLAAASQADGGGVWFWGGVGERVSGWG